MAALSPIVNALVNGQMGPCLIDIGSEITVKEYEFYAQQFGTQNHLDPSRFCMKTANNLPTIVEAVTWVKIHVYMK